MVKTNKLFENMIYFIDGFNYCDANTTFDTLILHAGNVYYNNVDDFNKESLQKIIHTLETNYEKHVNDLNAENALRALKLISKVKSSFGTQ